MTKIKEICSLCKNRESENSPLSYLFVFRIDIDKRHYNINPCYECKEIIDSEMKIEIDKILKPLLSNLDFKIIARIFKEILEKHNGKWSEDYIKNKKEIDIKLKLASSSLGGQKSPEEIKNQYEEEFKKLE
jgi:hypothetical protein